MSKLIDLRNKRFGKWLVLDVSSIYKPRYYKWLCRCDCGTERYVLGNDLRTGASAACGCHIIKHDGRYLPEYNTWSGLKDRCLNSNNARWKRYGGRGIKVHEPWVDSFEQFLEDVGRKPTPEHTLDRINNNGNYEPGNVKWSTQFEQAQNRENSRKFKFRGESKTVGEWSKLTNISKKKLYVRLTTLGWDIGKALTTL